MNVTTRSAGFVLANPAGLHSFRYLLLQHRHGEHWDFPKGTLEPGESDYQAAVRELREETGIVNIAPLAGFEHELRYQFRHQDHIVDKTVCYFLATTHDQDFELSGEHIDGGWFHYAQALEQITFDNSRQLLEIAHQTLLTQKASNGAKR